MKAVDLREMSDWCAARDIRIDKHRRATFTSSSGVYEIDLPKESNRVLALVRALFYPEETGKFGGGVVWFAETDLSSDDVGPYIAERMRLSYGVSGWPLPSAHIYERTELLDAQAMFALAGLFEWDGYYFPTHGEYFFFFYHHRKVFIYQMGDSLQSDLLVSLQIFFAANPNCKMTHLRT